MKPPICRICAKAEWGHVCSGAAPGAALAALGLLPATEIGVRGKRGSREPTSPLTQQGAATPGKPPKGGRPAGNVAKPQDGPNRARASSAPARRTQKRK